MYLRKQKEIFCSQCAELDFPVYFIFAIYILISKASTHDGLSESKSLSFTAAGDLVLPLNIVNKPPEASFLLLAFIMILFARCRFGGQPGLWRRGSGGEDVLLVRLPGGPDPCRLRPFTLRLYGGDPGGAAVRWPVETLPRYWYRNDHHKSRKVNLLWNVKYWIYLMLEFPDQTITSIYF